jgi:hypothetical protein
VFTDSFNCLVRRAENLGQPITGNVRRAAKFSGNNLPQLLPRHLPAEEVQQQGMIPLLLFGQTVEGDDGVVGDPEFLARLLPVVAIDCSALLVFDDGEENAMTADIVLRFPPIVRRLWPEVQYPLLELF